MEKVLLLIYHFFAKKRVVFYLIFSGCFIFLTWFSCRVKFEEDISKVIPRDKKISKLNEIFQNSKFIDKLVIMVSLKDTMAKAQPDSLVAFAESFGNQVQGKLKPYINKVNFKVDDELILKFFGIVNQHLPIYLTDDDYKTIDTLITPEKVRQTLMYDYRTLSSPTGFALKNIISNDPAGISIIALKKLQQLQYDKNFELYDSYVVTKDHRNLLLFITPAFPSNNTGKNTTLLQGIDDIINHLSKNGANQVSASYFGAAAVYAGNALQLRQDTFVTQGATVIVLILFLGFYFGKKRAPLIILIPVLFGSLFSLTIIYFIKGSISVIALGTGSVVLGIAINYSLHVFNHYRHTNSVEQVIKDLALPLTVGSFTTIGGFLCLEFVASDMLKDLGLFAAFSLIGASFCSLVFLPQFISTKKEQADHQIIRFSWIDRLASYSPEYNKYIVAGIFLMTIGFFFAAGNVSFEFDMTRMNFMSDKLKRSEAKLNSINKYALQSVYLVAEGKTLEEALISNERIAATVNRLKAQNIVQRSSGVSAFVISDALQHERIDRWNNYWTAAKKQAVLNLFILEGGKLGFKPAAFDQFKSLLNRRYGATTGQDMAEIRKSFLDDFINEKPGHSTVVTLLQTSKAGKAAIYKALDNRENITVIDKQYLTNKLVQIINSDFTNIAVMSSLLVFIVLWLTYGRIELTLVSFIPMFISWIWILGIMSIFGITFNIVNIIISALIFGLGDDYSLYIMDGLLQEYKTGKKVLSSFKTSIFLSAITTITGLGVLIFAKHPALKSIAFISIIGICCVVLIAQILIPFLFNVLVIRRTERKRFPWTLWGFCKTAFAFTYFCTGSFILTILGFLFKLNPFSREKGKLVYHFILSKFTWSMMYIMGNVKKRVINLQHEDFSKPAVVISNHQSFLDILSLIMLNPKLILFTNDWVWNSPVFGAVVKMADYYPVAMGVETAIPLLREKVRQGYSIVIFPEGTRSVNGEIRRFHKGAFYLAEQLQLDVLPILIHGTGYTMTKGDFLLKDGQISIKYLPRIQHHDTAFGTDYTERTKKISRYFKEQYQLLRQQLEQPGYYREQLKYNYLYKGAALEWHLKWMLFLEKDYQLFNQLLPAKGKILDIGSGYGFLCYMMMFCSPEREITGIDDNEEKVDLAANCFDSNSRIKFIFTGLTGFTFEKYDAIILNHTLHQLKPDDQSALIQKCFFHLNENGVILIKEANKHLVREHTSNQSLPGLSAEMIRNLAKDQHMECNEIKRKKLRPDTIYVIKKKQLVAHGEI
jgi:1-acyl-sn-glycerol-3-phosphate acyltransferase